MGGEKVRNLENPFSRQESGCIVPGIRQTRTNQKADSILERAKENRALLFFFLILPLLYMYNFLNPHNNPIG